MSDWAYVYGCLQLSSGVFEDTDTLTEDGVNYYLPFPDQQIKLCGPETFRCSKKDDPQLSFTVKLYSLPRALPHIKKVMNLFPSGEYYEINYSTHQNPYKLNSSANFSHPCVIREVEDKISEMYKLNYGKKVSFEKLKARHNIEINNVEMVTNFSLAISDNIRYACADEIVTALEDSLIYLQEKDIKVDKGIIEWYDSIHFGYIYNLRCTWDKWLFTITDSETNERIAFKEYKRKFNHDLNQFETIISKSDNWDKLVVRMERTEDNNDDNL